MSISRRRVLIVTLGRSRGALAAVRALGRADWFVGVGTPDARGMVTASRWCARRHLVPRPRGDAAQFIAAVGDAVRDGAYDIVFGAGDDSVAALATYRDQVPTRVAHPDADTVLTALDKVELARRAAGVGLAVPRYQVADEAALARWSGPVIVKCRSHWYTGQRQLYRIEARRYPDVAGAIDGVRFIQDAGFEAVLQEPIGGQLEALIGLFHQGRLLGRIQQQASRVWPTPAGVSSRAEAVPVDEELAARATALLTDLRWSGLVELQFLRPPGGQPHLIDLNGRFYGSMALASAAGLNLPDLWAQQVLGYPLPHIEDGRPGVRYVWLAGDVRRAFVERRGGLVADVASTLRWAVQATESVVEMRDLGPALDLSFTRLKG